MKVAQTPWDESTDGAAGSSAAATPSFSFVPAVPVSASGVASLRQRPLMLQPEQPLTGRDSRSQQHSVSGVAPLHWGTPAPAPPATASFRSQGRSHLSVLPTPVDTPLAVKPLSPSVLPSPSEHLTVMIHEASTPLGSVSPLSAKRSDLAEALAANAASSSPLSAARPFSLLRWLPAFFFPLGVWLAALVLALVKHFKDDDVDFFWSPEDTTVSDEWVIIGWGLHWASLALHLALVIQVARGGCCGAGRRGARGGPYTGATVTGSMVLVTLQALACVCHSNSLRSAEVLSPTLRYWTATVVQLEWLGFALSFLLFLTLLWHAPQHKDEPLVRALDPWKQVELLAVVRQVQSELAQTLALHNEQLTAPARRLLPAGLERLKQMVQLVDVGHHATFLAQEAAEDAQHQRGNSNSAMAFPPPAAFPRSSPPSSDGKVPPPLLRSGSGRVRGSSRDLENALQMVAMAAAQQQQELIAQHQHHHQHRELSPLPHRHHHHSRVPSADVLAGMPLPPGPMGSELAKAASAMRVQHAAEEEARATVQAFDERGATKSNRKHRSAASNGGSAFLAPSSAGASNGTGSAHGSKRSKRASTKRSHRSGSMRSVGQGDADGVVAGSNGQDFFAQARAQLAQIKQIEEDKAQQRTTEAPYAAGQAALPIEDVDDSRQGW